LSAPKGAFTTPPRRRDAAGRVRIIEAAVTGMAEQGRGDEAKALLHRDAFAGVEEGDIQSLQGALRAATVP